MSNFLAAIVICIVMTQTWWWILIVVFSKKKIHKLKLLYIFFRKKNFFSKFFCLILFYVLKSMLSHLWYDAYENLCSSTFINWKFSSLFEFQFKTKNVYMKIFWIVFYATWNFLNFIHVTNRWMQIFIFLKQTESIFFQ